MNKIWQFTELGLFIYFIYLLQNWILVKEKKNQLGWNILTALENIHNNF